MTSAQRMMTAPHRRLPRAALATAMLVLSLASFAPPLAAREGGKFYTGLGLATTDYKNTYQQVPYRAKSLGAQLFGGVQLRNRIALELAVAKLGGIRSRNVLGSGVQVLDISSDCRAITLRGVFSLELADVLPRFKKWTVFGTAGGYHQVENRRVVDIVSSQAAEDSLGDDGLAVGTGMLYRLSRVSLRAGVEWSAGRYARHSSVQVATQFRF